MNKHIAFALALALAVPAAAQQKPAVKKTEKPKPAAAAPAKPAEAKPAAPQAAAKPAEDPAAEAIARLKEWDEKLLSLKASFTQEVHFKEAGLRQSIEGTLLYSRPNLLRIEHLKPSRQLVVTDKKEIWIYKPEDRQAVRTDWETWRRTQDQNFSGILDFGNYAALTARNEAKVSGGKDGAPLTVTFTPRSGKDYSLTLTLSAEDFFPQAAELAVEGTVIRTTLTSAERNGKTDPAAFKFAPPKGAEVLEFKN